MTINYYDKLKYDRLQRELATLKRIREGSRQDGATRRVEDLDRDIAKVETLLEPEAWCHFDVTEETEGRDSFCGVHSAPCVGRRLEGLDQLGAPPLCEAHGQFVIGYVSGVYDALNRPDEFVIPSLDTFWNTMDCIVASCEAKGQLVLSSYVGGDKADPSQVYNLACGHGVL